MPTQSAYGKKNTATAQGVLTSQFAQRMLITRERSLLLSTGTTNGSATASGALPWGSILDEEVWSCSEFVLSSVSDSGSSPFMTASASLRLAGKSFFLSCPDDGAR